MVGSFLRIVIWHMGNARLRRTGSGGIKFKRKLSVDWIQQTITSESDVTGEEGTLERAYSFGADKPFYIGDVFMNPAPDNVVLSSTGRVHKTASGPFFRSQDCNFSEPLTKVTTFGTWCPNLPIEEKLFIILNNLTTDGVYEARLTFSNGKKNGASKISIDDSPLINIETNPGSVVVARFVAAEKDTKISIKSLDGLPPFINALVLRKLGTDPRMEALILLS